MRKFLFFAGGVLALFFSFALGFFFGTCSVKMKDVKVQESLQDELHSGQGLLLKISNQSSMSESFGQGPDVFSVMSVEYSGYTYLTDASHHNDVVKMSDDDLLFLYSFCKEANENGTFDDYSEVILDGATFTYIFYDRDGAEHVIYDGYCYSNPELIKVRELIYSYFNR
ncbi:MAG: hypothetical protein K6E28_04290 [Eubacterium sp.]|nr:hypothetical protein [Eubacterium sp.]